VGSVPVDPIAGWARGESIFGQIDKRWDSLEHGFLVNLFQERVALEAAGEHIELFEIKRMEHLVDLFFVIPALNQQTLGISAACYKACVAREDDTVLGLSQSENFIVIENVRVRHIEAEHSQPTCQFADHHIRDELDLSHAA